METTIIIVLFTIICVFCAGCFVVFKIVSNGGGKNIVGLVSPQTLENAAKYEAFESLSNSKDRTIETQQEVIASLHTLATGIALMTAKQMELNQNALNSNNGNRSLAEHTPTPPANLGVNLAVNAVNDNDNAVNLQKEGQSKKEGEGMREGEAEARALAVRLFPDQDVLEKYHIRAILGGESIAIRNKESNELLFTLFLDDIENKQHLFIDNLKLTVRECQYEGCSKIIFTHNSNKKNCSESCKTRHSQSKPKQ